MRDFGKVALTGGIASGKSTVCRMFSELGAAIIDADRIAREIVEPGREGWNRLREHLGDIYFDKEGNLNRRKLRRAIVEDASLRERVNALLHPIIIQTMDKRWRKFRMLEPGRPVIFDIPLLFEAGLEKHYKPVIVVYVNRDIQIERLMKRDGVSRQEAEKTISVQFSLELKRDLADYVIDNSGELALTLIQVKNIWKIFADRSLKEAWEN